MAEFPALPLWTDAYLADTRHLTLAEHGAYLLLLMVAWRTPGCALPNDDKFLGRSIGDPKNWPKVKPAVMALFRVGEDGLVRQKRLQIEYGYVECKRSQAIKAGRASALKRNERRSTGAETVLGRRSTHVQPPTPTPTPTPTLSLSEAKASVGKPTPRDEDREALFGPCLRWLAKQNGKGEDHYRSLVGKWVKDFGQKNTLKAITEARDYPPTGDVVAYITRLLNPPARKAPQI